MKNYKLYKFRIYPTKAQEKQMRQHLWIAKNLWNELLAITKQMYSEYGYFPTKRTLKIMAKNAGLYAQTQAEIADRLSNRLFQFITMKKQGKPRGFPRFKSIDRMKSLHYPQATQGFKLLPNKKLHVTPFGEINIKKHREIEGKIKTLTLKREPTGKWFAIFCVEQELVPARVNAGPQVGIDLGLKHLAVLSDGKIINNPRHLKKHEDELAEAQRRLAHKKRGSANRKKAKLKVALVYEKVANTRQDFLHKLTTQLVTDYSVIGLEKLASQEMSEQNFGKHINDVGWNMFANMIAYKAESAGCKAVFVDPKNTTQECSGCGTIVPKTLFDRVHECHNCGLTLDRDLNAARNILIRATAGHAESNACGDEAIASSVKQETPVFKEEVCHAINWSNGGG